MKRKHQRSIAYLVIALLGISLWHVWKSSKIAENPAYTKGVVNRLYKIRATPYYSYSYNVDQKTYEGRGKQYGEYEVCILVTLSPFIIKKVTPVTVKLT